MCTTMAYIRTSKLTPIQRSIAKDAVHFFIHKFMPRLNDKLSFKIKGKDDLLSKQGMHAHVIYNETGDYRPREFVITIDTESSLEVFIKTIMHEMVHVKQWAKGEMKYLERTGLIKFNKDQFDHDKVDYYDLPWEIEAHGREEGLFIMFVKKYPKWGGFINGSVEDYKMSGSPQMVLPFGR